MKIIRNICFILLTFCVLIIGSTIADISIEPEYMTGEKITVEGFTNFNTDNSVLVEIWPASFGPKGKYESSMTGGGADVVPVLKVNNSAYIWNSTFDSSEWGPDTYIVRAEIIGKDSAETKTFLLIDVKPTLPVSTIPASSLLNETKTHETAITSITHELPVQQTPESTPSVPVPTQKSPIGFSIIGVPLFICLIGCVIIRASR